ncbi:MAG TPA: PDZ domain-containing protein, partial [Thermoanaerobaculia bacterium]|nr:PDZ domain-containing protein [Thermoanaerobaculia bacterium]
YLPVGSRVNITLIRDGREQTVTATTAERPLEAENNSDNNPEQIEPSRNKLGMSVQDLTPQVRQTYNIDDNVHGVVVTSVKEVSPAGEVLSEGDVVTEVQGQKVNNVTDFRAAIDRTHSGQTIRLYVITPGRTSVQGYRFIHVP